MTNEQIRTWQQELENRFYEGRVTDLDVNQLLDELLELRGRLERIEHGNHRAFDPGREIERELIYGEQPAQRFTDEVGTEVAQGVARGMRPIR